MCIYMDHCWATIIPKAGIFLDANNYFFAITFLDENNPDT